MEKSVTYPYTVAFQRMHTSDHGQTVSDVLIRVPKIEGAIVNFTWAYELEIHKVISDCKINPMKSFLWR